MARIRTIKPDFFRHEGLQELELAHPGEYPMFVFAGLWGHCDKAGRFEWKPRMLKLDILPFLDFDMAGTLEILERADFVRRYEVDGKTYGVIDSFPDHQRIGGKEAQDPEKYPEPPEKQEGSIREALGQHEGLQEGKGREEEGKGIKPAPDKPARFVAEAFSVDSSIPLDDWEGWLAYRRSRKLTCSEMTIKAQAKNLAKWARAGHNPAQIIADSIASGWQGLFEPKSRGSPSGGSRDESREKASKLLTGRGNGNERMRDITGEAERITE